MLSQGDVQSALRSMLHDGLQNQPVMGLQEMLQRLKDQKQKMQDENNVDSAVEKIHERAGRRSSAKSGRVSKSSSNRSRRAKVKHNRTMSPVTHRSRKQAIKTRTKEMPRPPIPGRMRARKAMAAARVRRSRAAADRAASRDSLWRGNKASPWVSSLQSGEQQQGSSSNSQDGQSSGSNSPGDGTPQQSDQQGSAGRFQAGIGGEQAPVPRELAQGPGRRYSGAI